MNNEKVYLKGYVIGHSADTLGYKGFQIRLENMDIVEVDKNLIYKIDDEPHKVTIPQLVADYIKYTKETEWDLQEAMDDIAYEDNKDLRKWFNDNIETFARAWLDGYEVEKEKRYRISMPKARNHKNHVQFLCEKDGKIFWCGEWYPFRTKFTRKELEEAGFGWIFSCEGIEIEEVTE